MKGRHVGAYYLAGYAIECAPKACIARRTQKYDFPDKKAATDSYTHDLVRLMGVAGLQEQLDATTAADKAFDLNWLVVKDWAVEDRYSLDISLDEAKDLYRAISTRKSGLMAWIRRHW